MGTLPIFASVPRVGVGSVSAANTNMDGTGTLVSILTGVAAGTKIFSVTVMATVNPADSQLTLFYYDGTTNWLYDIFDLGDPATSSTTVPGYRETRTYDDLILASNTHILKAAVTVALTSGVLNVFAMAGDLT